MPYFCFLSLDSVLTVVSFIFTDPELKDMRMRITHRVPQAPLREKRCHKPHSPKKNVLVGSVPLSLLSFLVALCMCSVYTRMPCIFNRDSMLQGNVSNGVTALSILAQVL